MTMWEMVKFAAGGVLFALILVMILFFSLFI
jgi:hypothetical protein